MLSKKMPAATTSPSTNENSDGPNTASIILTTQANILGVSIIPTSIRCANTMPRENREAGSSPLRSQKSKNCFREALIFLAGLFPIKSAFKALTNRNTVFQPLRVRGGSNKAIEATWAGTGIKHHRPAVIRGRGI